MRTRTLWPWRPGTAALQAESRTSLPPLATQHPGPEHLEPAICTRPPHALRPTLVAWASCGGGTTGQRCLWRASCSGSTPWRWWEWQENRWSFTRSGCSQSTFSLWCPPYGSSSLRTTPCYPLLDLSCRTSLSSSFEWLWLLCLVTCLLCCTYWKMCWWAWLLSTLHSWPGWGFSKGRPCFEEEWHILLSMSSALIVAGGAGGMLMWGGAAARELMMMKNMFWIVMVAKGCIQVSFSIWL